jgi:hemoglobin/transferrin/lactoferrin receptor protein
VFLLSVALLPAQNIQILNTETKKGIENVYIYSKKHSELTDKRGEASLSCFAMEDSLFFQHPSYELFICQKKNIQREEIYLKERVFNLDKLVISANRWDQSIGDIPFRLIPISKEEIAFENPQTAADLLGTTGAVFVHKSQQGGGSPMIRGFATNRLLYSVDGVRMNTAIFRGGNIQNVISLDPFAMEKAEVLFGANSVLYGSDAIGGVMRFQSLNPEFSTTENPLIKGTAVMRHSTVHNEKTAHFDVNIGWKKWALVTSFSSFNFGDLKQGSNGPEDYIKNYYVQRMDSIDRVVSQRDPLLQIPTAYSQTNLMQKICFKANEKWDMQYAFHYSETSPYGRYDRHNRMRNDLPRYAEWNYGPQKWMMNMLSIDHTAEAFLYDAISIKLAQQSCEESRISRDFNKTERTNQKEEVLAYSANVDFSKAVGKKNTLFYGLEYVFNDVNSTGTEEYISTGLVVDAASRYPLATWQSFAAYLSDQYKFSDKFLVQAAVRYNHFILDAAFDTTFYHFPFTAANLNNAALTGSLGAVVRPGNDFVLSTNFSTAFRSPNVDDIGKVFDSEPGAVLVPNPSLEAEYAYTVDVSLAKVFLNTLKVDFSAYYTLLDNALVRRDYLLNGNDSITYDGDMSKVQAIQNAAKANVYGVQAAFDWSFATAFMLSSAINYQIGEEELDDGTNSPSRHAAPFFANASLSYKKENLRLKLYALYQGEKKHEEMPEEEKGKTEIYAKDQNGNTYAPSWYTLNFKASYRLNENIAVNAGIDNITDQRYRPYSSGLSAGGRNFVFSLKLNF